VAQFTVERDSNTAELTESLAVKLRERFGAPPFLVIARFERKFVDANRDPAAAYEAPQAKPYYESYHRALGESAETVRQKWGRACCSTFMRKGRRDHLPGHRTTARG
jgi:N-formylglutamate amidohydrolase